MNFDLEKILYITPIVVCSIAQIFLMIFGHTDKASKLEQQKQKLIRKRNKNLEKAQEQTEKIKEIKEDVANLKNGE